MENPIKMDDLGVPLFLETPIYSTARSRGITILPVAGSMRNVINAGMSQLLEVGKSPSKTQYSELVNMLI